MKIISRVILCVLITLPSCIPTPAIEYSNYGLSFTCPPNWKIKKELDGENGRYMVALQQRGLSPDGVVTITRFDTKVDVSHLIDFYKKEMKENIIYKNSDLTFSPVEDTSYSNYKTSAIRYTVTLLGIRFDGVIHIFYIKDGSISILMQETAIRKEQNTEAFRLIEKSFVIKDLTPRTSYSNLIDNDK